MILTIATGSVCVCLLAKTIAIAYEVSSRAPAPAYYFAFSFPRIFMNVELFSSCSFRRYHIAITVARCCCCCHCCRSANTKYLTSEMNIDACTLPKGNYNELNTNRVDIVTHWHQMTTSSLWRSIRPSSKLAQWFCVCVCVRNTNECYNNKMKNRLFG